MRVMRHTCFFFFFSSRRRHTRFDCDWSSDVCSSDLDLQLHIILNDALVRPAVERETIEARYPHFALWTDDCDATAAKIEALGLVCRSEERRVGKECRSRWSPYH